MKFFTKILIFIVMVMLVQAVLAMSGFRRLHINGADTLDKCIKNKCDVLYFGDSIIDSIATADKERLTLVQLLAEMQPDLSIGDISWVAHEMGTYEAMIRYVGRSGYRPKAIIIPINLGAFSPVINSDPMFQFSKEKFYFNNHTLITYYYTPLVLAGQINLNNKEAQEKYNGMPIFYGTTKHFKKLREIQATHPENLSQQDIKDLYYYFYMYKLSPEFREVKSLERIVEMTRKLDINLYVYITPIRYQSGLEYIGPEFIKQVHANTEVLCSVLKDNPCLNLVDKLSNNYLDTPLNLPGEHLKDKGRRFVAEQENKFFFQSDSGHVGD